MNYFEHVDILKEVDSIPQTIGYFVFYDGDVPRFVKSTENLQKFISLYFAKDIDNNSIYRLREDTNRVGYLETETLIEAFLHELKIKNSILSKSNVSESVFEIKPWKEYSYLTINFDAPPFIKITDDTVGDDYYIGPFRSRFVMNDILDIFSDMFKLPRCADDNFPCERLSQELCLGFCQNKLIEALPEMLNRLMMVPNKELIQKLTVQHEDLLNLIQIQKADILAEQISLLKRYYKHLLFAYISQFLEGVFEVRDIKFEVSDGMIVQISGINLDLISMQSSSLQQRRNCELLAYDKSEFDHRWIVFCFIYDTHPEKIEKMILESIEEIQLKVFI